MLTESLNMQLYSNILIFTVFVISILPSSSDVYTQQPRIISSQGNIIFQSAENHNITFKNLGRGRVIVNDNDLMGAFEIVKITATSLERLQQEDVATLQAQLQEAVGQIENLNLFKERVAHLETTVTRLTELVQNSTNRINNANRVATRNSNRIRALSRRVNTMRNLLNTDECLSSPCRNGGTCEDAYSGYICRCPNNWQGKTCEEDVNECGIYAGTPQGCQNGATCVNMPGSFDCQCTANWHGILCNDQHDDCNGASSFALCGHGLCHNAERVQPGMAKYECICDPGWKSQGGLNPYCVDIDECSWDRYPCSANPLVSCSNTQGSYTCGSCPSGYIGNGHVCQDVDECLTNNGGCSVSPMVMCTNTIGSRQCGACPTGYQGDGKVCTQINVCTVNNGGCSSLAICISNPAMIGGRECRCGPGYIGTGEGPYGCVLQDGAPTSGPGIYLNPCQINPCIHGLCHPYGTTYQCVCQVGYTGINCESELNPCLGNPCLNQGICTPRWPGYVCTCTNLFTGTNCELQQEVCGGSLFAESGNLKYPSVEGQDYQHNKDCVWTITTPAFDKVINLTFHSFHLEHNDCNYDFVQINDGFFRSAKQIGLYCGTDLPNGGNIVSTSYDLRIQFHSDETESGGGFELSWDTIDPKCGEKIEAEYGIIQSPGYPANYPSNRDCYWEVTVPPGKKISFQFHTLSLEDHYNCSYDFLEIRSGLLVTDPVLRRYCQTDLPPPTTTPGQSALIHFHSDDSGTANGFYITFTSIHGCGGPLTKPKGVFSSPDFPNMYEPNLECDWHIQVLQGERIRLKFTFMDVEENNCQYDYIEVWDGPDPHSNSINRYCGKVIPQSLMSTSNHLYVKFITDSSEMYTGFRAEYSTICGGIFTEPFGTIHSPYFPEPYPDSTECLYVISQPPATFIVLEFEKFDVESDYTNDVECTYDYVQVRDGDTEDFPMLAHLCGEKSPEPIVSTHNALWVKFETDVSVQNKGFLAHYRTEEITCGGIFSNQTSGTITSPGHPVPYPHDTLCRWVIRVPIRYIIQLTFTIFNLEGSQGICHYDYVEIFDNTTIFNTTGHSLGKHCGTRLPPPKTTMGHTMTIIFKSDESEAMDGFSATYEAIEASTVCGGTYSNPVGFIRSPNYPNGYPIHEDCIWIIEVPSLQQIEINVTDFELEEHQDCRYDFLEIRNGGRDTSPLIGTYCQADQIPKLIKSHSNQLYIHFHSDESNSGKGFNLIWDATSTGCGGLIRASSGTISSPSYPDHYPHNIVCEWQIIVSHGSLVMIKIDDLDIEELENCHYDALEFKFDQNEPGQKLCGSEVPPKAVISKSNVVIVRFTSDGSENGRGFSLSFNTECNNIIRSGSRGAIESPNFPYAYPHAQNCSWTIQAPWGNKIHLVFSHLEIESGPACIYDVLQVIDNAEPPMLIGKYCNSSVPPNPLTSNSEEIVIQFESDGDTSYNGFRLEWSLIGCGGNYIRNEGSISSPEHSSQLPRVACEWSITVDYGHRVQLTLEKFDLDFAACKDNSLQIFGGPDDTSPLLTSPLCHRSENPTTLSSTGNHMFLRYKRSAAATGSGFIANWKAVEGGCGGNLTLPTGVITSPNYPNNYNDEDDCAWLITVDEYHTIALTFQDFELEEETDCQYDYVAIYDGDSEAAEQIYKYCGTKDSNSFASNSFVHSTSNQIYIRFKADGSHARRGFYANYSLDCGGTLNANKGGIISVNPRTMMYAYSSNCSWLIKAENPGDQVTLAITELRILDSVRRGWNCSMGSLNVYDGENDLIPPIDRFCEFFSPPPITSQGFALFVVLTKGVNHTNSNSFASSISFTASYYESSSTCGGNYTSESGAFSSPGYPNNYPTETECVWIIQAPPGNRIQLSFSEFHLEESDNCNSDYLEIHEKNAAGDLLDIYCGDTIPSNLTVAEAFWIKFRSDSMGTERGFMARYKLLYGNDIIGTEGKIASPFYPRFSSVDGTFKWHITVPSDMYVHITFEDFTYNTRRLPQYMKVYDGGDITTGRLIAELRGSTLPDPITTRSNEMVITYRSFYYLRSRFLLSWEAVFDFPSTGMGTWPPYVTLTRPEIPGCGGFLNVSRSSIDTLSSPGYPEGYRFNLNCKWILDTEPGLRINVTFIHIDLVTNSYYPYCHWDLISVYDDNTGKQNWNHIGDYCYRESEGVSLVSTSNLMRIDFRSDYFNNGSGFLIHAAAVCGGYLYESSGVLTSPNYPNDYPTLQSCEWFVTVKPGRTILLYLDEFRIEDSTACTDDYLLFRNGATKNSPLLGEGKYCGNQIPHSMNTTSNHLYVKFVSDNKGSHKGFKLRYEEESIICGGDIVLTPEIPKHDFTTPNFPRIPPPHSECKWIIMTPPTHRVRLDFDKTFDITESDNCTIEFVEGYDGGTVYAPSLFKKCGKEPPPTIWSTGNVMLVRYFTDTDIEGAGFSATVQIAICGGTIVSERGVITSPDYPSHYKRNLNCEWNLKGPEGHFLSITPVEYDLPMARNCSQTHHIAIRDFNATGELLETYCGHSFYTQVAKNTSDNRAYIRFTSTLPSDSNLEIYKGFMLKFNASVESCGGEMTTPTGVITSPNYPNFYPQRRRCYWKIVVSPGRRITINFDAFNLEEKKLYDGKSYCQDSVVLFDGILPLAPRMGPSLCGSVLPPILKTSSNSLGVYFFSDWQISSSGFSLTYSSDEPEICGGEITSFPGQISSPASLEFINKSVNCNWDIRVPSYPQSEETTHSQFVPVSIIFNFTDLKTEPPYSSNLQCYESFVKILFGPEAEDTLLLHDLCGNITGEKIVVVPFSNVWMRYKKSVYSNETNGFNLTYSIQECGGEITDNEFTITSPHYPNNYKENTHCAWAINIEGDQQIKITFDEFTLDSNSKDYIVVYNGESPASSPKFGTYNTSNPPKDIHSMSNKLWIEFHSYSSGENRGFKLTGRGESGGCGGHYHSDRSSISSINFPNRYPNSVECIWEVTVPIGYHVIVTFLDRFDIQTEETCSKDFVALYEQIENDWQQIGNNLCGKQLPQPIQTKTNHFKIVFQSDENTNGDGFKLSWEKSCGGVFKAKSGTIYSPGFPENYGESLSCEYLIDVDPGSYLTLQFDESFELENETNCIWDSIEIFSGSNARGIKWGTYCGTEVPGPFSFRGPAFIKFESDAVISKKGFILNYEVQECGGNITNASGVFKSPTHPNKYHPNMRCVWVIKGTENQILEVIFTKFDMEFEYCRYDYVKIYDGDSESNPMIDTICGTKQRPYRVAATSNVITVVFVTDHIIHHDGFVAIFRSTYGPDHGCGGTKNSFPGTISSLDHNKDGNYEAELTCIWLIETSEPNKVLKLSFDKFDIEAPTDLEKGCPWDYLEIRDGFSEDFRLIRRACGTTPPPDIITSKNTVWIKFVSDSTVNKPGFSLTYSSVNAPCGGVLEATNSTQELKSPEYPMAYPLNTLCSWTITAPYSKSIHLTFTDFEMEESPKCAKDHLEIMDQTDENWRTWMQLEGIYCGKNIPHHFLSYFPLVKLNFVSDDTNSGFYGFKLNYRIATCNYSYEEEQTNGRIRFNMKEFNPTDVCIVSISTTEDRTISLYFTIFEISWSYNCSDGFLKIHDGDSASAPQLQLLCGYGVSEPVYSTGNHMFLVFKPPGGFGDNLMDLTYTTTNKGVGCGGTVSGINGSFTSPNFPGNYSITNDCQWLIQVPPRGSISLTFHVVNLFNDYYGYSDVYTDVCGNTYISVYEGKTADINKRLAHFCNMRHYFVLQSTSNEMLVQYVTSTNTTGSGFRASFSYVGWQESPPEISIIPKD